MYWLILGVLCALFAVTALILWQKWAAPWSQIEQLVSQVARGEPPSTFLINGGAGPHRIGLSLENIFARQQELERQIAGRESGTQTILGAMQDGLLVVDARSRIMLMNQPFEKLFGLRELACSAPDLQLRDELPLFHGAHRHPAANFLTCAQASGTKPLRVQCTDLGTGRRGPLRTLQVRHRAL